MAIPAPIRLQQELAKHPSLTMREWYRSVYLSSPHWLDLRIRAKAKYGNRCRCGAGGCDVHHINYRNIFDVTVEDLMVLCRSCHKAEHGNEKIKRNKPKKQAKLKQSILASLPGNIRAIVEGKLKESPPSSMKGKVNWTVRESLRAIEQLGLMTKSIRWKVTSLKKK